MVCQNSNQVEPRQTHTFAMDPLQTHEFATNLWQILANLQQFRSKLSIRLRQIYYETFCHARFVDTKIIKSSIFWFWD